MPQAKSGAARSRSGTKRASGGSSAKKSSAGSTRSGSRSASSARSSAGRARPASAAAASGADDRLEAAAQRVRKLNERIIEAGKGAGEATLTSYEKALKAIASGLERGAGASDVEWISNLATAQAKFIRDVTEAWTSAARGMLK
jgi:hypothetical protein